jgi:xanthine dehydrogenase YagS FAD-binding subunit
LLRLLDRIARRAGLQAGGYASAEWPLVEVVVRVVIDNAQFRFVRVAPGGIAPVAPRFERVENALQSRLLDSAASEQAASLAIEGAPSSPQTGHKLQRLQAQIADVLAHVTALEDARDLRPPR